jgi:uncharacterized protein GlcG (DUF336 family)
MNYRILNLPRPRRGRGHCRNRNGGQAAFFVAASPLMIVFLAFLAVLVCRSEAKAQLPADVGNTETEPLGLIVLDPGQLPGPREAESTETVAMRLSDVRDIAKMFDDEAVAAARKELRRIQHEMNLSTVIETVDTLNRESIEKAAVRLARHSGIQGIFILIAKKEHTIEVLVSHRFQSALTRARQDTIKEAFIKDFRHQEFNDGLKHGVAAIRSVLADVSKAGELPKPIPAERAFGLGPSIAPPAPVTPALVVRDRVRLTLAGARTILAGAEAKAASMQLKINIAVVDDGGHLLAFERVDGARPASAYTAITKATSAATFRQPTGPQPPSAPSPDLLLNLSLQNAAQASGGKITSLYGGVPIVVDDQVIGGVGIGGGTGEQDAQIARAGIQSLLEQLAEEQHASKAKDATEKAK